MLLLQHLQKRRRGLACAGVVHRCVFAGVCQHTDAVLVAFCSSSLVRRTRRHMRRNVQDALRQRFEQARVLERQMHDVSQLGRSMAVELTSQMEASEKLYRDALVATEHIGQANVQLRKTVAVKKGSGWWLFLLLVAAGIALLVADALYPG